MTVSSPAAVVAGSTSRPTTSAPTGARGAPRSGARTAPVRLLLPSGPGLVSVGLQSMLEPYRHRVALLRTSPGTTLLHAPDVELIDTSKINPSGPALRRVPWPRIALLWDTLPRSVYRAELLDIAGSVMTSASAEDLVVAIERVHRRQPARGVALPTKADLPALLSPREAQILSRIAAGKSNGDIGREMYLSLNTVKTYVRTAYRKIDVTSRTQAVLWSLDNGF